MSSAPQRSEGVRNQSPVIVVAFAAFIILCAISPITSRFILASQLSADLSVGIDAIAACGLALVTICIATITWLWAPHIRGRA